MRDNHPALPAPFPTRTFVAIAIVWVLIDLPEILLLADERLAITLGPWNYHAIWFPLFAAKVMLQLAWLVLGDGTEKQRSSGILLFAPLLVAFILSSSEPLAGLFCVFISAIFLVPLSSFPYLVYDGRLTRDAPRLIENKKQLSLRQLMLLTFLVATLLGLLRWVREADAEIYWLLAILVTIFCWFYPLFAMLGFLSARLYPNAWYAVAGTIFSIVLPLMLKEEIYLVKEDVASSLAMYMLFIAAHILMLRGLGYRLVRNDDMPLRFSIIPGLDEKQREPIRWNSP